METKMFMVPVLLISGIIAAAEISSSVSNSSIEITGTQPPNRFLSVVNNASQAIVWDPYTFWACILNGQNGSAVVYNFRNNSGAYMPGGMGSQGITWNCTLEPMQNYLSNLSMCDLYTEGTNNGTMFTINNITQDILDEIANALSNWDPVLVGNQTSALASGGGPLETFANVSSLVSDLFNDGPLQNLWPLISNATLTITRDIPGSVKILEGLCDFFKGLRGGVSNLLNQGFQFDPNAVFNASNGLQAFVDLLEALNSVVPLNEVLDYSLNHAADFLKLISSLGGNNCDGITGVIITMLEEITTGTSSCNTTYSNLDSPSAGQWKQSVQLLYNITQDLGPGYGGLQNIVRGLMQQVPTS